MTGITLRSSYYLVPTLCLYHPAGRITHWLGQSNKDDFWVYKQYGRLGLAEKTWNKTPGTGRVPVPVSELAMSSNFFGFKWNEVTNVINSIQAPQLSPPIFLFMDTWSQPHHPSLGLNLRRKTVEVLLEALMADQHVAYKQVRIKPWGRVGWNIYTPWN